MSVVNTHDFNSRWLGVRFGIAHGPALLTASREELLAASEGYDVLEVRCDVADVPTLGLAPDNGLVQVDTQLGYQLPIDRFEQRIAEIDVRTFAHDDVSHHAAFDFLGFDAERYARLVGVDTALLDARYQSWAHDLVEGDPGVCLIVRHHEVIVGYSFARRLTPTQINLDLVTASRATTLPGLGIYRAALATYRSMGVRKVTAAFSARNVAAANIHAALGCRITSATDVWFFDLRAELCQQPSRATPSTSQ